MTWTASTYWGAWMYDLGPYTDPFPGPPADAVMPPDTDIGELDYVITANDFSDFVSGSFSTGYLDGYAYWSGGSLNKGAYPSGGDLGPGTRHLFLLFYTPDYDVSGAEPTYAPSSLAPAAYVAPVDDTWYPSDVWGGYVARLGPYIGPWPPSPPIPANVPSDAERLDYIIAPGALSFEDIFYSLYSFGDHVVDLPRSTFNTGTGLSWLQTVVVDPQLYLIWYPVSGDWPSSPPSETAGSLVPPLYNALGTGVDVFNPADGRWSDWADIDTRSALFRSSGIGGHGMWFHANDYFTTTDDPDRANKILAAQAYARTFPSGSSFTSGTPFEAYPGYITETAGAGFSTFFYEYRADLGVGYNWQVTIGQFSLLMVPNGPDPRTLLYYTEAPMVGLIEGVDWSPAVPGSTTLGDSVQYEGMDHLAEHVPGSGASWTDLENLQMQGAGGGLYGATVDDKWNLWTWETGGFLANVQWFAYDDFPAGSHKVVTDLDPTTLPPVSDPTWDVRSIPGSNFDGMVYPSVYFQPITLGSLDLGVVYTDTPGSGSEIAAASSQIDVRNAGFSNAHPEWAPYMTGTFEVPRLRWWVPATPAVGGAWGMPL